MSNKIMTRGVDKPHFRKLYFGWTCSMAGRITGVGADLNDAWQAFLRLKKTEIRAGWAIILHG